MFDSIPILRRLGRAPYVILYVAVAVALVARISEFYHPRTGFTSLIVFGDRFETRRIPALRGRALYTYAASHGYDGQFYAQLAVAGTPFGPEVEAAMDSAAYRAHRMLLPAIAHVVGLGRPRPVLAVYALSNLFCWLVLAALLARWWFPPTSLDNLLRWAGTLLGAGMLISVTRSLADGPALLAMAAAMRALELGRRWLAAGLFAVAGLVREMSVIGALALFPTANEARRAPWRWAGVAALAVGPVVLWGVIVRLHFGPDLGERAFDPPFVALAGKVRDLVALARAQGWRAVRPEVFALVAFATQVGFVLLRPRPREAWWRFAAPFAVLALVLGSAVWKGSPSAACRLVLPLTLAFNVLVPRTRRGLALLVAGNLTVLSAVWLTAAPPPTPGALSGVVDLEPGEGWFPIERNDARSWRWSAGAAEVRLRNRADAPLAATLTFELSSVTNRTVRVKGDELASEVALHDGLRVPVRYGPIALPPGETRIAFTTVKPPWQEPGPTGRPLAFAVYDLAVELAPLRIPARTPP